MDNRIIGVLNYKGGTGKTTTAINLGAGLALRGERVLCIDLDPQGDLAAHLGVKYTETLSNLLLGISVPSACIYQARENLDVLPSTRKLLNAERELWKLGSLNTARRVLADKLRLADDAYSYILVDFPPASTLISENGLLYINELLIPMVMSHLSLMGTRQVIGTLKAVSRIPDHSVTLLGILPVQYAKHLRKDRDILEIVERKFKNQVLRPIRNNVRLAEAPAEGKTIYEYASRSYGAADYANLVEQVVGGDSSAGERD